MSYPMKVLRKLQRVLHRLVVSPRELLRLFEQDDPTTQAVAAAIQSTFSGNVSLEEQAWISRIESLRKRLNASTELLDTFEREGQPDVTTTVGEICRSGSKPPMWALLLFHLVRQLKPMICLEMGTCLGISASYLGSALILNGQGQVITLEGLASRAKKSQSHFDELEIDNVHIIEGRFETTLAEILTVHAPIDFVFVDGHHDGPATVAYFEQILPHLSETALLLFDDIIWSHEMQEAWQTISRDPRVYGSIDLFKVGICAMRASSQGQAYQVKIALD